MQILNIMRNALNLFVTSVGYIQYLLNHTSYHRLYLVSTTWIPVRTGTRIEHT